MCMNALVCFRTLQFGKLWEEGVGLSHTEGDTLMSIVLLSAQAPPPPRLPPILTLREILMESYYVLLTTLTLS